MKNETVPRFCVTITPQGSLQKTLEDLSSRGFTVKGNGIHPSETKGSLVVIAENKGTARRWDSKTVSERELQNTLNEMARRGQNVKAITPHGNGTYTVASFAYSEALQPA